MTTPVNCASRRMGTMTVKRRSLKAELQQEMFCAASGIANELWTEKRL
jgi:hypothetical protein